MSAKTAARFGLELLPDVKDRLSLEEITAWFKARIHSVRSQQPKRPKAQDARAAAVAIDEVCNARGKCILDREPGKLIRISEDGEIGTPVRWKSLAGSDAVPFDTAFPFVATPPSVDPSPIFTREAIINGDASERSFATVTHR